MKICPHAGNVTSFPGHFQILSRSLREQSFSSQLLDKIWEHKASKKVDKKLHSHSTAQLVLAKRLPFGSGYCRWLATLQFKAGEKPDHGKEAAAQLCASVYKPSP